MTSKGAPTQSSSGSKRETSPPLAIWPVNTSPRPKLGSSSGERACRRRQALSNGIEAESLAIFFPYSGKSRSKNLATADIKRFLEDVMRAKTAANVKTRPRGLARVTGGTHRRCTDRRFARWHAQLRQRDGVYRAQPR